MLRTYAYCINWYMVSSTLSISSPFKIIFSSFFSFEISFVFFMFIICPDFSLFSWNSSAIFCRSLLLCENKTVSSANLKLLSHSPFIFMPFFSHPFSQSSQNTYSRTVLYRFGASGSPCITPLMIGNLCPSLSILILPLVFVYMASIIFLYFGCIP